MKKYESYSPAETRNIGYKIAEGLKPGDVLALDGELGCGKTHFVKGVVDYFADRGDEVTSPTFTLVNQYDGSLPIYHFDVYRLENISADECDWMDDYLFGDGICLIEWADNIRNILPEGTISISFCKNSEYGEDYREITIC